MISKTILSTIFACSLVYVTQASAHQNHQPNAVKPPIYWHNSMHHKAPHGVVHPKGYSGRYPYPSYHAHFGKNKYLPSYYKYRWNYHYYDRLSWLTYRRHQDYHRWHRFKATPLYEGQTRGDRFYNYRYRR